MKHYGTADYDLSDGVLTGLENRMLDSTNKAVLHTLVCEVERIAIQHVLWKCANNLSRASETLGITRTGLRHKMRRYNINREEHQ